MADGGSGERPRPPMDPPGSRSETPRNRLLVLLGLTGFAISQPVLSVLGENPEVFSLANFSGRHLVVFALVVAFVPPLVLAGMAALCSLVSRRAGRAAFLIMVGVLAAVAVVQVAEVIGFTSPLLLVEIAIVVAIGAPWLYQRWSPGAMWLRYTAVLPVLAALIFVVASPTGQVVFRSPTSGDPDPEHTGRELPSVVMMVLDEFPTGTLLDERNRIDDDRFPHLAGLAADATWYRRFTTMAPFTEAAVPSLLSGRVPSADRATFTSHPDTLFSLLGPTHDLYVDEITNLCAEEACRPRGPADLGGAFEMGAEVLGARLRPGSERPNFDQFADEVAVEEPDWEELLNGDDLPGRPSAVEDFVASLRAPAATGRPSLHYLHLMLPHQPWLFYPDGTRYAEPSGHELPEADAAFGALWSPWSASLTRQRHVLQAQYTDSLVGDVIDALVDAGTYDDTLVVIVADHGVSFETRGRSREPTFETLDEIAYTPFIVKAPRQTRGVVSDANLMSIDVLPTMADVLGIPVPWATDGVAASSSELRQRGSTKIWYDLVNPFAPRLAGTYEYEPATNFPEPLTTRYDPEQPLSWLLEPLNVDHLLVESLADIDPPMKGTADIADIELLRRPSRTSPPLGLVDALIENFPDAEGSTIFLVEVNGAIVTASPVYTDSAGTVRARALLPPGSLRPDNEIRVALATFIGVIELDIA